MSVMSWKKEFYSESAEDLCKRLREEEVLLNPKAPKRCYCTNKEATIKMLRHALLKFTGTTKGNLAKHKVRMNKRVILPLNYGGGLYTTFLFGGDCCALCHAFNQCKGCPIRMQGAHWDCCQEWKLFADKNRGNPMRKLLKRLIRERKVLK